MTTPCGHPGHAEAIEIASTRPNDLPRHLATSSRSTTRDLNSQGNDTAPTTARIPHPMQQEQIARETIADVDIRSVAGRPSPPSPPAHSGKRAGKLPDRMSPATCTSNARLVLPSRTETDTI